MNTLAAAPVKSTGMQAEAATTQEDRISGSGFQPRLKPDGFRNSISTAVLNEIVGILIQYQKILNDILTNHNQ